MKDKLTAHDIANTVRMMRSLHLGTILIVEGDADILVYERFVDDQDCKIEFAGGKNKTLETLAILEEDNFKGVLAIVDADFWKLDNINPPSSNVLMTDTHDLEGMILSSKALDKFLSEFGLKEKIRKLGKPVLTILLENALPIGCLRWISSPGKDDLNLKFEHLDFPSFIDKNTLGINLANLIAAVKTNSRNSILNDELIRRKIEEILKMGCDPLHLCSGHDLVKILTFGIKNIFGKRTSKKLSTDTVERTLRIAYENKHFSQTKLYDLLKEWETTNPSYNVLA